MNELCATFEATKEGTMLYEIRQEISRFRNRTFARPSKIVIGINEYNQLIAETQSMCRYVTSTPQGDMVCGIPMQVSDREGIEVV